MDTLRQDAVQAVRALRRDPGFTAVIVLTIGIGIGALTAIFSVVDAVLFRPLPFAAPERIVQVWSGSGDRVHGPTSPANFVDWRASSRSFEAVAAEDFAWFEIAGDSAYTLPERRHAAVVSPDFFRAIGVQPALGRGFTAEEERADARVAVLGHALWMERFGGDRAVVGRRLRMNGESYEVVGVMPEGFDFPATLIANAVELWVPLGWTPANLNRGLRELGITARLRPGVTLAAAQAETDAITRRLEMAYPDANEGVRMRLVPMHDEIVGGSRRVLVVLFAAVSLVLLIACANVANLLLARAQARHKEIALRSALGASRVRIVRQLLTEAMLLAIGGGLVGAVLAAWLTDALVAIGPSGVPRLAEITVDVRVLAFALGATALSGIAFGLVPALGASGTDVGEALRSTGRSVTAGRDRRMLRNGIVVLEVGIALVLLVGAGLLLRSLDRLMRVNPGFEPSSVLTAQVVLPPARYADDSARARFAAAAIEQLRAAPGVRSAAAVDYPPFGRSDAYLDVTVEGFVPPSASAQPSAQLRAVSADYFETMGVPLRAGRTLEAGDRAGAPLVAVVNEEMARRYWPGVARQALLGKRVREGGAATEGEWLTVVGIVGDVKHWRLDEDARPQLYRPLAQAPAAQLTFVIRSASDAPRAEAATRQALLSVDREQSATIRPMAALVGATTTEERFRSALLGAFAVLALLLAVIGIYGVVSRGVAQRTRELGVRLALGAQQRDIVRLVVRQGMRLTAGGLVVGIVAAVALTRVIRGMLFDVAPTDWITFVGVSALLAATAAIANYLPARRASRVDPMVTMQSE